MVKLRNMIQTIKEDQDKLVLESDMLLREELQGQDIFNVMSDNQI